MGGFMTRKQSLLADYFQKFPTRSYKKGRIILEGGPSAHSIFYIEEGFVNAYKLLPNGTQKIYLFYKPGEFFPIISTFSGIHKNLFYEALSNVVARRASKEEFLAYIGDKPDVLKEVIARIIDNHSMYVDRVDNLEYTNAYARLISRLLFLAEDFGEKREKGILIKIPLTHVEIANTIAMTRETASREVERLQKKDLIAIKRHLIFIPSVIKLRHELDDAAERAHL
jgi:CRP/FNR family transcriptional regulator